MNARKTLFVLFCVLLLTEHTLAGSQKRPQELKAKRVPLDKDLTVSFQVKAIPPIKNNINGSPADGIVIGTTDYDYGWGAGFRKMIVTHGNGAHIHMIFMERDILMLPPLDRRAVKYIYYDWAKPDTLVKAYPFLKSTTATGFGNIDVFTGGLGDNFAVIVAHKPIWFALDSGPGAGKFTSSQITTTNELDPAITVDDARQILWVVCSGKGGSRTDYWVLKSIDYGIDWTNVDSNLCRFGPSGDSRSAGAFGVPFLVAPNGNLILVTTLSDLSGGDDALPPIGTAHPDSTSLLGYFNSTDAGVSWTWTTISKNGERFVFGGDTLYWLSTNFGQFSAVCDKDSKIHIAAFGYFLKFINDSTTQRYFGTMYWKTGMTQAKLISNYSDLRVADYDTHNYSGNALGFAYPSIACDPAGSGVFAIWSQPRVAGGRVEKASNGFTLYDLWYAFSLNSGDKWSSAAMLANSDYALFVTLAPKLSRHATDILRAHFVYLKDTVAGGYVFGESTRAMVPWIYRTVDFGIDVSVDTSSYQEEQFLDKSTEFLLDCYPNPFNSVTTFSYRLTANSFVSLEVFDIIGRIVETLVSAHQGVGKYKVQWNASGMPSGIYFYQLRVGGNVQTKKMLIMR